MGQTVKKLAAKKFDWIECLHALRPWNGVGEFGLDAIQRVLQELGDPQDSYQTIHIAGTNGKGSTAAYLAEIISRSGLRAALLISPHLERVNERISVDGQPISDSALEALIEKVLTTARDLGEELSFFETVTACGFLYCREQEVDYSVVEVGLGGRLDATNVISKPEWSIITSIGLDHHRLLGDSEVQIAREKAGIIKSGAQVVLGPVSSEVEEAISHVAVERGGGFKSVW